MHPLHARAHEARRRHQELLVSLNKTIIGLTATISMLAENARSRHHR